MTSLDNHDWIAIAASAAAAYATHASLAKEIPKEYSHEDRAQLNAAAAKHVEISTVYENLFSAGKIPRGDADYFVKMEKIKFENADLPLGKVTLWQYNETKGSNDNSLSIHLSGPNPSLWVEARQQDVLTGQPGATVQLGEFSHGSLSAAAQLAAKAIPCLVDFDFDAIIDNKKKAVAKPSL